MTNMTPELLQKIEQSGAVVELSDRTKLMLRGADRVRYLNGQVTNDVRKTSAGSSAIHACVTNAKGRIEGDVFIHAPPDSDTLCLDAEGVLRESLRVRLERYIVADDVELVDISDGPRLWHFFGQAVNAVGQMPVTGASYFVPATRFGVPGVDLWLSQGMELPQLDCPQLSREDLETFRILRGIPRWPHELNGDVFPQEAGLETSAMDFSKGCYIGQEVLSRIKTTGKMPRVMVKWEMPPQSKIPVEQLTPARLFARGADDQLKEIGQVTSACMHPLLDRGVGLGYVRQSFEAVHSLLLAHADEPTIAHEVKIIRI